MDRNTSILNQAAVVAALTADPHQDRSARSFMFEPNWEETGGGSARQTLGARKALTLARLLTDATPDNARLKSLTGFLGNCAPCSSAIAQKIVEQGPPTIWDDLGRQIQDAAKHSAKVSISYEWGIPVLARALANAT